MTMCSVLPSELIISREQMLNAAFVTNSVLMELYSTLPVV